MCSPIITRFRWMVEDKEKLMSKSLVHTQAELKKYNARMRFKKAIHSVSVSHLRTCFHFDACLLTSLYATLYYH